MKLKNLGQIVGKSILSGTICALVWGCGSFMADAIEGLATEEGRRKMEEIEKNQNNFQIAPFYLKYSRIIVPIAGATGAIGGLAAGIADYKKNRKILEEYH